MGKLLIALLLLLSLLTGCGQKRGDEAGGAASIGRGFFYARCASDEEAFPEEDVTLDEEPIPLAALPEEE